MTKVEIENALAAYVGAELVAQGVVGVPVLPKTFLTELPDSGTYVVVACDDIAQNVHPLYYAHPRIQVHTWALHNPEAPEAAPALHGSTEKAIDRAFVGGKQPAISAAVVAATDDAACNGFYVEDRWNDVEDDLNARWASEKPVKLGLQFDEGFEAEDIPAFVSFRNFADLGALEAVYPAADHAGNHALVALGVVTSDGVAWA